MTIRTATICHNESDCWQRGHRRVKLVLERDELGYIWRTDDGQDCCIAPQQSVAAAIDAARFTWGAPLWDLRATWA